MAAYGCNTRPGDERTNLWWWQNYMRTFCARKGAFPERLERAASRERASGCIHRAVERSCCGSLPGEAVPSEGSSRSKRAELHGMVR